MLAAFAVPAQTPTARIIAQLEDTRVNESSGVVGSRAHRGIYWTHNDSGAGPVLYGFDLEGRARGHWKVTGADAVDWEDIAIGPGPRRGRWYLYIGDIGDNQRRREQVVVYRVEEPRPAACESGCATGAATAIRLRYPDGPHNAEALLIHPATSELYIVTKANSGDRETAVYKASLRGSGSKPMTLARVAVLGIPEPYFVNFIGGITGGEISSDGRRVVLSDYFRAYEAVLPTGAAFDKIWRREFTRIPLGVGLQVEGICYRPGAKSIIATSEGKPCRVLEAQ